MKLLSIETSCDDTAITLFEAKGGMQNAEFEILSNNSNSQIPVHIPHGGVYPKLAKGEHIKNLPILLEKTLIEAGNPGVDLIAVTYGPGLEPALWTGIVFAQNLAKKWKVPIIPVNHMEGHVLSVFGKGKGKFKIEKLKAPILSLLVSGGHTQLVLTKKWLDYKIIGQTLDDAVGEAFDKVARMLGLPYPGGPEISKLAEEKRNTFEKLEYSVISFPRPMLHSKNFDFSFSGLKTSVLYYTQSLKKLTPESKAEIALEFENAAIETLVYKTKKAAEKYKAKTLIIAGGVAANKHLRREISAIGGKKFKLLFPTPELSGDNSIMIGIAGYLNYLKNKKKTPKPESIKAAGNLKL